MNKGKLIVIDGADGSGKTTQSEMLIDYLKSKNIPVVYFDFPQYQGFYGQIIARFLRGEFGTLEQVSPYLASIVYALDRASVKDQIQKALEEGKFVICNRYATTNLAHQAVRFTSGKARNQFVDWVIKLEYKIHKLPKEDLVIYLHVPWEFSRLLMEKKGKIKDIVEKNDQHQKDSIKMYLELTQKYKHWVKIDCVKNGKLLSKEEIFQKIIQMLFPI